MNEEYHIQVALVQWLKTAYPKALFTIAPNGMKLSIGSAVKLKRMGYSKGTPDIMIFEPRHGYHGLFIELKTKTGQISPEQKIWNTSLEWRGYRSIFCYSFEEAVNEIDFYLKSNAN
jgi:hypothetical protein